MREWLNAQAAGGFVDYDPETGRYSLAPEQTVALTEPEQPGLSARVLPDRPGLSARFAARSWRPREPGTGSAGTSTCMTCTRAASGSSGPATTRTWCRSGYPLWTASTRSSTRGAGGRCRLRARILDDPDGAGLPATRPSPARITTRARSRPRASAPQQAGVSDRVRFQAEPASGYSGGEYDLVTMFDCLHDMGDPVGAARHVCSTLTPDGTWMIVEPNAGDRVEDNLNPVGRAYYAFSTLLCTPASLSQEVGLALGAQAGEARINDVVQAGGLHAAFAGPPRRRSIWCSRRGRERRARARRVGCARPPAEVGPRDRKRSR